VTEPPGSYPPETELAEKTERTEPIHLAETSPKNARAERGQAHRLNLKPTAMWAIVSAGTTNPCLDRPFRSCGNRLVSAQNYADAIPRRQTKRCFPALPKIPPLNIVLHVCFV